MEKRFLISNLIKIKICVNDDNISVKNHDCVKKNGWKWTWGEANNYFDDTPIYSVEVMFS